MIYKPFDVVVVPFPFTDSAQTKKRPALMLSSETFDEKIEQSVLSMITSQKNDPWPLDCTIKNKNQSGLAASSVVRIKLFTLDNSSFFEKLATFQSPIKTKSS
jgi:mRNA interferase MazF